MRNKTPTMNLNLICHNNPGNPLATTLKQILLNKNATSLVKNNATLKDKGQRKSYSEIHSHVSQFKSHQR